MDERTKAMINKDRLRTLICKLQAAYALLSISKEPDTITARELVCDSVTLADSMLERGQRGSVAIVLVLCLPVLMGCLLLAVSVGALATARTQAQNAADAAALAGASALYLVDRQPGLILDPGAAVADLTARNNADLVSWDTGHEYNGTFTVSPLSNPNTDWWVDSDLTADQLQQDPLFVNAVRVEVEIPVIDYFGANALTVGAQAVAVVFVEQGADGYLRLRKGSRLTQ